MNKQLNIRLDRELTYTAERDFGSNVADLWNRIGKKLKQSGKKTADVKKAILSVRAKK